jgi:hypothetical protein
VYTDESVTIATEHGGRRVLILLSDEEQVKKSLATGEFFSHFRTEDEVFKTAAVMLMAKKMSEGKCGAPVCCFVCNYGFKEP